MYLMWIESKVEFLWYTTTLEWLVNLLNCVSSKPNCVEISLEMVRRRCTAKVEDMDCLLVGQVHHHRACHKIHASCPVRTNLPHWVSANSSLLIKTSYCNNDLYDSKYCNLSHKTPDKHMTILLKRIPTCLFMNHHVPGYRFSYETTSPSITVWFSCSLQWYFLCLVSQTPPW
jgi:hypothetical protein